MCAPYKGTLVGWLKANWTQAGNSLGHSALEMSHQGSGSQVGVSQGFPMGALAANIVQTKCIWSLAPGGTLCRWYPLRGLEAKHEWIRFYQVILCWCSPGWGLEAELAQEWNSQGALHWCCLGGTTRSQAGILGTSSLAALGDMWSWSGLGA